MKMKSLYNINYHEIKFSNYVTVEFYVDSRYQNLQSRGEGAYGYVVSAFDTQMKRDVAIKKFVDPLLHPEYVDELKRTLREMKLLRHFRSHENVVTVYDIMTFPPDAVKFQHLYVVTNLFDYDLETILSKTPDENLSSEHQQFFLYQILRGLKFIHSSNIIHRDLKPSNLLVNKNCDLAICDFGLSRELESNIPRHPLTQYVQARWYRAPELLSECPSYGKPIDIWSVGCIFAEILTLQTPFFDGQNSFQQLISIIFKLHSVGCLSYIDGETYGNSKILEAALSNYNSRNISECKTNDFDHYFPHSTSATALDLLKRMLAFNPSERITVEEALAHPFLVNLHDITDEPNCHVSFNFGNNKFIDNDNDNDYELHRVKRAKTGDIFDQICINSTTNNSTPHGQQLQQINSNDSCTPFAMQTLLFKELQLYRSVSDEVSAFLSASTNLEV